MKALANVLENPKENIILEIPEEQDFFKRFVANLAINNKNKNNLQKIIQRIETLNGLYHKEVLVNGQTRMLLYLTFDLFDSKDTEFNRWICFLDQFINNEVCKNFEEMLTIQQTKIEKQEKTIIPFQIKLKAKEIVIIELLKQSLRSKEEVEGRIEAYLEVLGSIPEASSSQAEKYEKGLKDLEKVKNEIVELQKQLSAAQSNKNNVNNIKFFNSILLKKWKK